MNVNSSVELLTAYINAVLGSMKDLVHTD